MQNIVDVHPDEAIEKATCSEQFIRTPSDYFAHLETFAPKLGSAVKVVREFSDLSQTELAEELSQRMGTDIRQWTLSEIETDKRDLRAAELLAICSILKIRVERLCTLAFNIAKRSKTPPEELLSDLEWRWGN